MTNNYKSVTFAGSPPADAYRLDLTSKSDTKKNVMCLNPLQLKLDGQLVVAPCRTCRQCLKEKFNDFFNNNMALYNTNNYYSFFSTFTYDDEHVKCNSENIPILCVSDFQKFLKRLRKEFDFKVSYCGEYGGNTARPHYHAIFYFDINSPKNLFIKSFVDMNNKSRKGIHAFRDYIAKIWKNGFIDIELVRHIGALSYISKYISKPYLYPLKHLTTYFERYKNDSNAPNVFNLDIRNINHQRKVLKYFGVVPQYVRRSVDMLKCQIDSKYIKLYNDKLKIFFNKILLDDYGKSLFSSKNNRFTHKENTQAFLQLIERVDIKFDEAKLLCDKCRKIDLYGKYYTYLSKRSLVRLYDFGNFVPMLSYLLHLVDVDKEISKSPLLESDEFYERELEFHKRLYEKNKKMDFDALKQFVHFDNNNIF